jgi:membrane-bound lytic murein transglycosylase
MSPLELIEEIKESYYDSVKKYIAEGDIVMAAGEMNVFNMQYFHLHKSELSPYTNGLTLIAEGAKLQDVLSQEGQTKNGCAKAVKTFEMYLNQLELAMKSNNKHSHRKKRSKSF